MILENNEMQSVKEHFDSLYKSLEKLATKEDFLEMKKALIRTMWLLFIGQVAVLTLILLFVKDWVA